MRLIIVTILSTLIGLAGTLLILWITDPSDPLSTSLDAWRWMIDFLKNLSP